MTNMFNIVASLNKSNYKAYETENKVEPIDLTKKKWFWVFLYDKKKDKLI